ncbi:unnamed protein product [Oikopleura dioica]|uniref:Uncharacterized protein n=1 Tax=Oikopleura dioica TaxID=34765 RepID=E4XRB1_OIKDI|nr:unnamed protein product [Oikopleura dioica]
MSADNVSLLDTYANDSVSRSHKKHLVELKKWELVVSRFAEDIVVTGTSRLVESSFAELKSLERSSNLPARRIFVVATSKYNKVVAWLDGLTEARKIAVIERALLERPENEKKSKQATKEDLRALTGIVADNEEEVPNVRELNQEDDNETDESEEEEDENYAHQEELNDDVLNAVFDNEEPAEKTS